MDLAIGLPVKVRNMLVDIMEYGQLNWILVLQTRGQRCCEEQLSLIIAVQHYRFCHPHLIHGKCTCLVSAEYVHASQLFDGCQAADNGLAPRQIQRAYSHGHRKHSRQGHGYGGNREYQGKTGYLHKVLVAEQGYHHDQQHQDDCNQDQEIADLDHHFLEMAALFQTSFDH
ncbi:hypothetical protein BMS3Abin10_00016 [bacterium BMS3Abin10]|nr:hypothetical protein BMS3Abin10_00016 [bacterium BMS3Abin10]